MRDLALKFLSDEIGARGGSIEIGLIAGKLQDGLLSMKNLYILSDIAHLDSVVEVSNQARFIESMQNLVTRMDNGNGANDRYIDKRMFELLDIRSSQIADNVKKGGGDLFYEQNKGSIMAFGDMMMGLAQVSVLYSSYTSWAGQQRTQGYSGYERDLRDAEIGQSNRGGGTGKTVVFQGKTVTQNNVSFDPNAVDRQGRTNIQRMEKGLAPIGYDGQSINIHHADQTNSGPVIEMPASSHQQGYSDLHSNTGQSPSLIGRNEFNQWRTDYWRFRANDFK